MEGRWLSVDEIAAYLDIKRGTVYKWTDHKSMPTQKVGRLWEFKREEVDEWVRRGSAAEKAGKASADDESNQS
jgi:excisionase family DNA binding protein